MALVKSYFSFLRILGIQELTSSGALSPTMLPSMMDYRMGKVGMCPGPWSQWGHLALRLIIIIILI